MFHGPACLNQCLHACSQFGFPNSNSSIYRTNLPLNASHKVHLNPQSTKPTLPTLQHLLRRLHHLLHLPTPLLHHLLHRGTRFFQLIRPGSFAQLHPAQLLLLLAARVFDRRSGFVAGFGRFGHGCFARVGGRGRDVDDEEERVGSCRVGLGREGEGGGGDGGGDGFDVL